MTQSSVLVTQSCDVRQDELQMSTLGSSQGTKYLQHIRLKAITFRLEAFASRLEAIADLKNMWSLSLNLLLLVYPWRCLFSRCN